MARLRKLLVSPTLVQNVAVSGGRDHPDYCKCAACILGKKDKRPLVVDRFVNWQDFVVTASDITRRQWAPRNCGVPYSVGRDVEWLGSESMEHAADMALNGWPQGRDLLHSAIDTITEAERSFVTAKRYDVAGDFPDVMRAIGGDPMAMMQCRPALSVSKPVIHVVIERWNAGLTTPKAIMNWGAATLSYVDALETRGFSVEIDIIFSAQGDKNKHVTFVPFKRAGDALDIDRAAFAIAHPSALRRFDFGLYEHHAQLDPDLDRGFRYYAEAGKTRVPGDVENAIGVPACDNAHKNPRRALSDAETYFREYLA